MSVWKELVTTSVCVAEVRTRVFNAFVFSTKVFVSSLKRVRLQLNNVFIFWLEVSLETPEKRTETTGKSFCKTWFQVGIELKKYRNKDRMQEDCPTSAVYFRRCRVVFLRSFISALFLYFFQLHPNLESSFTENFP